VEIRSRVWVQNQRAPRLLREVEVLDEVSEDLRALAHVRARIGTAVGLRVEACGPEKVVAAPDFAVRAPVGASATPSDEAATSPTIPRAMSERRIGPCRTLYLPSFNALLGLR